MKKTLLLLTLSVSMLLVKAQWYHFADTTAQWNILEHQWGWFPAGEYYYTHVFEIKGDTLINGISYQAITDHYYAPNYLRRDIANRIWLWYNNADIKIYDFGAMAGDSITGLSQYGFGTADIGCRVDSADTVNWNGIKKRMYVSCSNNMVQYQDVWIDGVGSVNNHSIWGGSDMSMVDGPEYSLLCYFEAGQLQYHDSYYDTCIYNSSTSVDELSGEELRIYPNPAIDYVTMHLPAAVAGEKLQVVNVNGEVIKVVESVSPVMYFSVKDMPAGVYFVQLIAGDKLKATSKLVVLRP